MPDFKCKICLSDFQSMSDLEMHINNNSSKCDESNAILISNHLVLKPNNFIENQETITTKSITTENSQTEEKKHKLMKEIDDCSLDLSSVNSRTRFRKSQLESEMTIPNENHVKNDLSPCNHDKKINDNCNNKENNFEDLSIKPVKNSDNSLSDARIKPQNNCTERTDEDDRNAKKSNKLSFICPTCPEEFETAYQLKTHVFLHRYESQNMENGSSPTTESESLNGNVSSSETLSVQNSSIKRQNTKKRKKPDSDVEEQVSKIPKKILTCDLCPKIFHRPENLTVHRNKFHNMKKLPEKKSPSNKSVSKVVVNALKCQQCSLEFESPNILQIHQTAYCFKAASDLKEWVSKNMSYHFGCVVCGLSFKSSKRLEFHKEEHANFKWPTKKSST